MLLVRVMIIAGGITLLWSLTGLILSFSVTAGSIFPENRPRWLTCVSWAYLTLALLGWAELFQSAKAMAFFSVLMITLTAIKFFLFYFFYKDSRSYLVLLWQNRPAMNVVSLCSAAVGALMIFIACRTL